MEYVTYERGPGITDELIAKYRHVQYGYALVCDADGIVKVVPIGVAPPLGDANA
tara:strand:+ start:1169 stop:1330 length:162 start_codon:yes stop_codon:yes gene_type:complete